MHVAGWFFWVAILISVASIVFVGLGYVGIIGKTIAERNVFEQSYQKKSSDADALSTYDAQVVILKRRLRSSGLTNTEKSEVQAQIDSINILKASRGN